MFVSTGVSLVSTSKKDMNKKSFLQFLQKLFSVAYGFCFFGIFPTQLFFPMAIQRYWFQLFFTHELSLTLIVLLNYLISTCQSTHLILLTTWDSLCFQSTDLPILFLSLILATCHWLQSSTFQPNVIQANNSKKKQKKKKQFLSI